MMDMVIIIIWCLIINDGELLDVDMDSALKIEKQCYEVVLGSEDRMEGLMAFKEKRNPNFKGK